MSLTETLRTLHRIQTQLGDLRGRLQRGPKQIQAAEANVKKAEAEREQAKENYKQVKMSADGKQLQLRQREAKLVDLQGKLHAANSNKEYQLLKDQIAADNQANSVLSDEILEALERLDGVQVEIKAAEESLAKMKEELAKVSARVNTQNQQLEGELARVSAELEAAETHLPEDLRPDYFRLTKSLGADALSAADGETCGGCFQTLTPQVLDRLRLDRPLFCKSCGRLMYLAEGK